MVPALIYANPQVPHSEDRTIGEILMAHGRISPQDVARIVTRQKIDKRPFGELALELKVLTKGDIDFALSKQFDYPYLVDKDSSLSTDLVAAYQPFSLVGENLRAVRSQLMLRWFNSDRRAWYLPSGPVSSMMECLERAGCIVMMCDMAEAKIDAASYQVPGLPPVIFVNDALSGDRLRFTLAHELGHLILHRYPKPEMEREADTFALARNLKVCLWRRRAT